MHLLSLPYRIRNNNPNARRWSPRNQQKAPATMNKQLIQSVIEQIGDSSYMRDIYNHGIMGGFPGFTYYADTIEFFKNNRTEIVALVKEQAQDFGQTPIQFVASFRCLNNAYNDAEGEAEIARALYGKLDDDDIHIPNALAWFVAEEAAREYIETGMERDEPEEE